MGKVRACGVAQVLQQVKVKRASMSIDAASLVLNCSWDAVSRDAVLSLISDLQREHCNAQALLRNQLKVMAAFSQHPQGEAVHSATKQLQAAARSRIARVKAASIRIAILWKGKAARLLYLKSLRAVVLIQATQRKYRQYLRFKELLAGFPERSRYRLLESAAEAKVLYDNNMDELKWELGCLGMFMPWLKMDQIDWSQSLYFATDEDLVPDSTVLRLRSVMGDTLAMQLHNGNVDVHDDAFFRSVEGQLWSPEFLVVWLPEPETNLVTLYNPKAKRFLRLCSGCVNGHGGVTGSITLPSGWEAEKFEVRVLFGKVALWCAVSQGYIAVGQQHQGVYSAAAHPVDLACIFFNVDHLLLPR